jgi:hypothetical protein
MSKTLTSLHQSLKQADRLEKRERHLQKLTQAWAARLERSQNGRLATALVFFLSTFPVAIKENARLEFLPLILSFFGFLYLVGRTRRINRHLDNINRLLVFTKRQKNRCLGLPSGRPYESAEKASIAYSLTRDIGLMGQHSLWTLLDETISEGGVKKLLQWMSAGPQNIDHLRERQGHIASLRTLTWFYTRLGLKANANEVNLANHQIQDFIKNPFVQDKLNRGKGKKTKAGK